LLTACATLAISVGAKAQTTSTESRQASQTRTVESKQVVKPTLWVPAAAEEGRPRTVAAPVPATNAPKLVTTAAPFTAPKAKASEKPIPIIPVVSGRFDQLLLSAIQSHLGSPYHYTGTGPNSFDCSGLVWKSFQEAGLDFTRGPARSYWATFPVATREEETKFGTLVFFSHLRHVGIVVDGQGFYHASRHNGVIYSPFNDYWLSRVDGFRRIPLSMVPSVLSEKASVPSEKAKAASVKPASFPTEVQGDEGP